MYQPPTKAFNQAVKRNLDRFPDDFMFQLTEEAALMRSQMVTASRRNTRHRPYVFAQEGVAMLSSVLTSSRAIQVNIAIMRVFARLRELAGTHRDLAQKIAAMEKKYDAQFRVVFKAIRKLVDHAQPQQVDLDDSRAGAVFHVRASCGRLLVWR